MIEKLLVVLALFTMVGTGVRGLGGTAALFAGTLVAGFAIAIAQALVPILIRVRFAARAGVLTGGFSMALTFGASVAAGLAVPLQHLLGSWEAALAAFAVPAGLAALVWLVPAGEAASVLERASPLGLHRLHGSWSIALLFGLLHPAPRTCGWWCSGSRKAAPSGWRSCCRCSAGAPATPSRL
ncbi:MAG: hypothetical protein ACJ77E_15355 [Gaiellaceae bacterium]